MLLGRWLDFVSINLQPSSIHSMLMMLCMPAPQNKNSSSSRSSTSGIVVVVVVDPSNGSSGASSSNYFNCNLFVSYILSCPVIPLRWSNCSSTQCKNEALQKRTMSQVRISAWAHTRWQVSHSSRSLLQRPILAEQISHSDVIKESRMTLHIFMSTQIWHACITGAK